MKWSSTEVGSKDGCEVGQQGGGGRKKEPKKTCTTVSLCGTTPFTIGEANGQAVCVAVEKQYLPFVRVGARQQSLEYQRWRFQYLI